MKYESIAELIKLAEEKGCRISDVVCAEQADAQGITIECLREKMHQAFQVMKDSSEEGFDPEKRSASGLTGGDAYKMKQAVDQNKNICGKIFGEALAKALSVSQTNACMGRIVAAPTAGSCGILPAALITIMEAKKIPEETVVDALSLIHI